MPLPPCSHRRFERSGKGPLDDEIAREKAAALGRLGRGLENAPAALGRLGRGLENALKQLADFDEASDERGPAGAYVQRDGGLRAALVEAAAHAFWLFMVQREACGMRDARAVVRDYGVPAAVQARAGAVPPRRKER